MASIHTWFMRTLVVATVIVAIPVGAAPAAEEPAAKKPKIYDEQADGKEQIAAALKTAKKEQKRVLLQFGANWCGWCHRLHGLMQKDKAIAEQLQNGYVVVLVDVDNDHNEAVNTKYGNPTRFGLPVIVVLDADGKQLTTKNTEELEEGDHHDPAKVAAFLKEWSE